MNNIMLKKETWNERHCNNKITCKIIKLTKETSNERNYNNIITYKRIIM